MSILDSTAKYLIEGIAIAIVAFLIPQKKPLGSQLFIIALSIALVFAILDNYSPMVANGVRQGAGIGIGAGLVGGIPMV